MKVNKSFLVMFVLIIAATSLSVIYPQDRTMTVQIDTSVSTTESIAFKVPNGYVLTGIDIPTLNASTTALTIMCSTDGSTFKDLWYGGSAYSETITNTGLNLTFEYTAIFNWEWYKLKVNQAQTANRSFILQLTRKR